MDIQVASSEFRGLVHSELITGSWKVPARRLNRGLQLWLLPETHIPATARIVHSFPPLGRRRDDPCPVAGPPKDPSCEIPEFCKRSRSVPARRAPDRFLLAPSTIVHHRQTPTVDRKKTRGKQLQIHPRKVAQAGGGEMEPGRENSPVETLA